MSRKQKHALYVIVGPTAVGKTEIACRIAKEFNGEILSADSMQVYRGMDMGTSKPSRAVREKIPHHLIDLVEPTQTFDAVQYRDAALGVIPQILSRGKNPMLVGGSGLYVRVLLEGIFPGPRADRQLRQRLYQRAAASGSKELHERLQGIDSVAAMNIHPNDLRRIIRALEVYEQSGIPISNLKPNRQSLDEEYDIRVVGLTRSRAHLYERINKRVDQMFAEGFVDECRGLMDLALSQTARQALGYKEVFSYLSSEVSLDGCIHLVKRNTRRYAKRQLTWFRHDSRVGWISIEEGVSTDSVVKEVIEKFVG